MAFTLYRPANKLIFDEPEGQLIGYSPAILKVDFVFEKVFSSLTYLRWRAQNCDLKCNGSWFMSEIELWNICLTLRLAVSRPQSPLLYTVIPFRARRVSSIISLFL